MDGTRCPQHPRADLPARGCCLFCRMRSGRYPSGRFAHPGGGMFAVLAGNPRVLAEKSRVLPENPRVLADFLRVLPRQGACGGRKNTPSVIPFYTGCILIYVGRIWRTHGLPLNMRRVRLGNAVPPFACGRPALPGVTRTDCRFAGGGESAGRAFAGRGAFSRLFPRV